MYFVATIYDLIEPVCLSVCLTLIDQKVHRYINPVNQTSNGYSSNGYSWSVAHEKVCDRASHVSSSHWMTKWAILFKPFV